MAEQTAPVEGRCHRCEQPRPLFPYKPVHDCIDDIGRVDLIEAAVHIAGLEDQDDIWCTARIERRPRLLCVPCHDRDHAAELDHMEKYDL